MLRRLILTVPIVVLALGLFTPGPALAADTASGVTLLATEAVGENVGTAPRMADDPANPNSPAGYESPFLQNAAGPLAVGTILLIGGIGMLYYGLVLRPRAAKSSS